MSRFEKARAEAKEAARQRARPSALQIAWLVVLLAIGGTVAWLAITAPPIVDSRETAATAAPPALPLAAPAAVPPTAPELPQAVGTPQPAEYPVAAERPPEPAPPPAAAAGLVAQGAHGPLPVIAPDGSEPWQVYARPHHDLSTRPRIALVISGLGLRKSTTDAAIDNLPPAVTLVFSPYGADLQARVDQARQAGHEVMLLAPMEPDDYPRNDPGPHTLLVLAETAQNLDRLHWVMSRFTGYVGVMNDMGSKFTSSEEAMTPILSDLKARGLLFLDARTSQYSVAAELARSLRVPRAINNRYIDNEQTEEAIRRRLEELENLARTYGAAAGVGRLYPVTIKTAADWAAGLPERGFDLAPVSAIANRQPVR